MKIYFSHMIFPDHNFYFLWFFQLLPSYSLISFTPLFTLSRKLTCSGVKPYWSWMWPSDLLYAFPDKIYSMYQEIVFKLIYPDKILEKDSSVNIYYVLNDIYLHFFSSHLFINSNNLSWSSAFFVSLLYKSIMILNKVVCNIEL